MVDADDIGTPKQQYYQNQVVGVAVGRSPSLKRRVKSALDGARAGGLEVARIEVDRDDKIIIIAGKPLATETDTNPWDEVLKDAAH